MAVEAQQAARLARKAARQAERRERILAAAFTVLGRDGAAGLSAASIAAEANMAAPGLYHYFESLDAVVVALATQAMEGHFARLEAAIAAAPDGVSALEALLRERVALYAEDPAGYEALQAAVRSGSLGRQFLEAVVYPASARINGALEARILADQGEGRVHPEVQGRLLANLVFLSADGIIGMAATMARLGGGLRAPIGALLDEAVAQLRRGCAPPGDAAQRPTPSA